MFRFAITQKINQNKCHSQLKGAIYRWSYLLLQHLKHKLIVVILTYSFDISHKWKLGISVKWALGRYLSPWYEN